jgi:hypothetical protein
MTNSIKTNVDKKLIEKAKKAKQKTINNGKVVQKDGNTKV